MLALLSPFIAEFLLGDQYLAGLAAAPQQIGEFILFVAFYGMAAVLIRELARRLRIGWAGLLLLALGYGIFEEGLITQSLFNPHYLGLSLIQPGYVPGLGIGAPWTIFVLTLHVVWSISSPIAIAEAWFGRGDPAGRGTDPWLGRVGIVVCLVIFVLAAAATAGFSVLSDAHQFVAPPARLIAAAVAVALAILSAVRLRGRQRTAARPSARAFTVSALLTLIAASGFELIRNQDSVSPWVVTVILAAIWAAMLAIVINWSRRADTRVPPGPVPFGMAAGAVITYGWVGLVSAARVGAGGIIEQAVLVAVALAVVGWTAARSLGHSEALPRPAGSPVLG